MPTRTQEQMFDRHGSGCPSFTGGVKSLKDLLPCYRPPSHSEIFFLSPYFSDHPSPTRHRGTIFCLTKTSNYDLVKVHYHCKLGIISCDRIFGLTASDGSDDPFLFIHKIE